MRFPLAALAAVAMVPLALFGGRAGPSLWLGGAALFGGRAGPSLSLGGAALAHGDAEWIMRGQHRNQAGEWCCGEGDCFVIPPEQVKMRGDGYVIFGVEKIPFTEAQPSPDGAFWRCKRPDGTRRCFFAPPPAT